jgi:alginate O-acetyltransferase complex protein AlgI
LGIILPIGISFFTFTQIAYLVDAYRGKVREAKFVNYLLFVTYFPHLIAGPVLHHKEMMPQFDVAENYRPNAANFTVGLTIFAIGLAKKVLLADNLAPHANPVFVAGAELNFLSAWVGVLAYTFQLYFDFSGYSDMAIGLSRMFGVKLPLNFDSPYKSRSISEFWRRWHMTLSRFLRDYLYIPLGGNRAGPLRQKVNLMVTMVLGGLWHGAGWTFVIWGTLHGLFLVVNHFWSGSKIKMLFSGHLPEAIGNGLAWLLTFLCATFAWVYFRSPDLATANHVVSAMLGQSGVALPEGLMLRLGAFGQWLSAVGVSLQLGGGAKFVEAWVWILIAMPIAFLAPNTQQIMSKFEPALAYAQTTLSQRLVWNPNLAHSVAAGVLLGLAVLSLSNPTEFLYFQF